MRFFKVATLQKLAHLQPCNVPFSGSDKVWTGLQGCPFQRTALAPRRAHDIFATVRLKVSYNDNHKAFMTFAEIDSSGKKSFTGKYTVSAEDYEKLTTLAKRSYSAESEAQRLREENGRLSRQIWSLQSEVSKLRTALRELTEKCRPYLEALKIAPQKVKEFIGGILEKFKKQEKSIYYEPISAREQQSPERGKRFKNKDYER